MLEINPISIGVCLPFACYLMVTYCQIFTHQKKRLPSLLKEVYAANYELDEKDVSLIALSVLIWLAFITLLTTVGLNEFIFVLLSVSIIWIIFFPLINETLDEKYPLSIYIKFMITIWVITIPFLFIVVYSLLKSK